MNKFQEMNNEKFNELVQIEKELDSIKKICGDYLTILRYADGVSSENEIIESLKSTLNNKNHSLNELLRKYFYGKK